MNGKRLIALLLLILLISLAAAHSGRTDASGGHWDRSTGEYHYHHGYSAHQHIDGTCPYDFDDQTNSASGSFSNDTSGNNEVKKDRKKVHDMVDALRNGETIPEVDSGYRTPEVVETEVPEDHENNQLPQKHAILLLLIPLALVIIIISIKKRQF